MSTFASPATSALSPATTGLLATVAATDHSIPTKDLSTAECVCEENSKNLKISDSVNVTSLNGIKCNQNALIDTDSPVFFLQASVFKTFFGPKSDINKSELNTIETIGVSQTHVI